MRCDKHVRLRGSLALAATALLSGCNFTILDPKGSIGHDERSIILLATGLMLLVIVPVIALTLFYAWKYRASNRNAPYAPDWSHSTRIEVVVWSVPCVIIALLAAVTWESSHRLDPFRPLASTQKPMTIDVVALDWKWLFIFPDQHIATVNQIAMPVGVPVTFNITSDSVMNSFAIPQLGGQIYAMAGMQTQLNLVADQAGTYDGLSANYSGAGFSDMTFKVLAVPQADFDQWVARARQSPDQLLSDGQYRTLAAPSQKNPPAFFSSVDPHLFHKILSKCFVAGEGSCAVTEARG